MDPIARPTGRVPVVPEPPPPLVQKPPLGLSGKLSRIALGGDLQGGKPHVSSAALLWFAPQPVGLVDPAVYGLPPDWLGFTFHDAVAGLDTFKDSTRRAINAGLHQIDNSNPRALVNSLPLAAEPLTSESIALMVKLSAVGTKAGNNFLDALESIAEFMHQGGEVLHGEFEENRAKRIAAVSAVFNRILEAGSAGALPAPRFDGISPVTGSQDQGMAEDAARIEAQQAAANAIFDAARDTVSGIRSSFPLYGQSCGRM